MSEQDPAIVGIQSCGCVTYANARPDDLDRDDEKDLARILREGGQVLRTTVAEARALPDFLPRECPHDPKGWEYKPPEVIVSFRNGSRGCYFVYANRRHLGYIERSDDKKSWDAFAGWSHGNPKPLGTFRTRDESKPAFRKVYKERNAEGR